MKTKIAVAEYLSLGHRGCTKAGSQLLTCSCSQVGLVESSSPAGWAVVDPSDIEPLLYPCTKNNQPKFQKLTLKKIWPQITLKTARQDIRLPMPGWAVSVIISFFLCLFIFHGFISRHFLNYVDGAKQLSDSLTPSQTLQTLEEVLSKFSSIHRFFIIKKLYHTLIQTSSIFFSILFLT